MDDKGLYHSLTVGPKGSLVGRIQDLETPGPFRRGGLRLASGKFMSPGAGIPDASGTAAFRDKWIKRL